MPSLLLTEVFPPQVGGSGKWLYELYRRFPADECVVAAGDYLGGSDFDSAQPYRTERLPLRFPSWGFFESVGLQHYWSAYRRVSKLIQHYDISAMHCGKVLPEGWLAWMCQRRYGLSYWVFVHGEELIVCRKSRQLSWMARRVFNHATGIIANSHNTASLLKRDWSVDAAKLHVVHPGVDITQFSLAPVDMQFRERHGWQNRRVVLTVSRLQKRKGHDTMLRALLSIRRQVPDVLYVIVGDGDEREFLEALSVELGVTEAVQFVGHATEDQMREYYQQCDLFVLANREVGGDFEGFGMVLLEAQACGKPVVAGNSGGTSETMNSPHTGLCVDCEDHSILVSTVCELLSDPAQLDRMGQAARQWVVENFDWPRLADEATKTLGINN